MLRQPPTTLQPPSNRPSYSPPTSPPLPASGEYSNSAEADFLEFGTYYHLPALSVSVTGQAGHRSLRWLHFCMWGGAPDAISLRSV